MMETISTGFPRATARKYKVDQLTHDHHAKEIERRAWMRAVDRFLAKRDKKR